MDGVASCWTGPAKNDWIIKFTLSFMRCPLTRRNWCSVERLLARENAVPLVELLKDVENSDGQACDITHSLDWGC
jgi:hypothetical protein